jgi:hypothetical protein
MRLTAASAVWQEIWPRSCRIDDCARRFTVDLISRSPFVEAEWANQTYRRGCRIEFLSMIFYPALTARQKGNISQYCCVTSELLQISLQRERLGDR